MMMSSAFSGPIPSDDTYRLSPSASSHPDDDEGGSVREPDRSRTELKQRTTYLAVSMPFLLAFLYVSWLVYDAGFVYREMTIDIETARVMVETSCNREALMSKKYTDEVITSTVSSKACQDAKNLSDCDQLTEFDTRFRKRRSGSDHWFSGDSIVLKFMYWTAVHVLYNPFGAIGGVLLVYYISRKYWSWIPGPFLHACRDVYRSQRDSKRGLPTTSKKTD